MNALAYVDIGLGVLVIAMIIGILVYIWRQSHEEFKELMFYGWLAWLTFGWAPSLIVGMVAPMGWTMFAAYGVSILATVCWVGAEN